jgi:hypothetical protein
MGRSPLALIAKRTLIPLKTIREVLFVFIHHNLVTFAESEEGSRFVVYYEISILNTLLRDRFAFYILMTRRRFNEDVFYVLFFSVR